MTVIYGIRGEDGRRLSRPLLARAVNLAWGWNELPRIEVSSRGKPFFPDHLEKRFSLSHSGGIALCALSDGGAVGVDVELVRPHREGLPRYALSEEELAEFDGSWEDFARLWTLKESWCKRQDSPLFPPRRAGMPDCPRRSYGGGGWRGAVCCSDEPPEDIIWLDGL